MTFRDFARNYLNPFYLLARICWLWGAFLFAFLAPNIDGLSKWNFLLYIIALAFLWNGLRPWGKGMSINDINNKLDHLGKKHR